MTTITMPPRRRTRTPDARPATALGTFAEFGLDRRLV
jgi:hypothetical protein